jgi:hypothetical protein
MTSMNRRDMARAFDGKTGQDFVDAIRALAIMARIDNMSVMCGSGCGADATHIGMQRCGAPGGPVCTACMQRHRDWCRASLTIAGVQPWCRHCQSDVGPDHIYALDLYDTTIPEVSFS